MCLAVPGKVVELVDIESPFISALVEFGLVRRLVSLSCVPEALPGDFVMVHAGIAISRINKIEAGKVLEALEELGLIEDSEPTEPGTSTVGQSPASRRTEL